VIPSWSFILQLDGTISPRNTTGGNKKLHTKRQKILKRILHVWAQTGSKSGPTAC